jgi:hypothetical protein
MLARATPSLLSEFLRIADLVILVRYGEDDTKPGPLSLKHVGGKVAHKMLSKASGEGAPKSYYVSGTVPSLVFLNQRESFTSPIK